MASNAVTAMPHNFHHLRLPHAPRVRPPRMMPGVPQANTNPRPPGPAYPGRVWAQGKWRLPIAPAAKHKRRIDNARLRKAALRHREQGLHIFAYYHIRTKQVVYSLSEVLQESQIMPQLLFLGKQTKPTSIRRDLWKPYFSVHFPQTPAGIRAGMTAYQRLREFSIRRQLSPTRESLLITEADIKEWYEKGDPVERHMGMMDRTMRPPPLGKRADTQERAKKIMETQKATSVADVAFVLKLAVEQIKNLTLEDLADRTRERIKYELGPRGKKRLLSLRKEEEEKRREIKARLDGTDLERSVVTIVNSDGTQITTSSSQEPVPREGLLSPSVQTLGQYSKSLSAIDDAQSESQKETLRNKLAEIEILWSDIRDGTHAQAWPDTILHGTMVEAEREKNQNDDSRSPAANAGWRRENVEYWNWAKQTRLSIMSLKAEVTGLQEKLETLKELNSENLEKHKAKRTKLERRYAQELRMLEKTRDEKGRLKKDDLDKWRSEKKKDVEELRAFEKKEAEQGSAQRSRIEQKLRNAQSSVEEWDSVALPIREAIDEVVAVIEEARKAGEEDVTAQARAREVEMRVVRELRDEDFGDLAFGGVEMAKREAEEGKGKKEVVRQEEAVRRPGLLQRMTAPLRGLLRGRSVTIA